MLILSRGEEEGIMIGEDIKIVVMRISRHSVRIGILAPEETLILRDELWDPDAPQERLNRKDT
jgi:carbon storage regulator